MSLVFVDTLVEGDLEEAVAARLLRDHGGAVSRVYGKTGRAHVLERAMAYNQAARHSPWLAIVDLERDHCAPDLLSRVLPSPAPRMCFRVAVRTIESWLLADNDGLSRHLGVNRQAMPASPDELENPKVTLVNLCRGSRKRDVRLGMVPRPSSGRQVGPLYNAFLLRFVHDVWQWERASTRSPSLARAAQAIQNLVS